MSSFDVGVLGWWVSDGGEWVVRCWVGEWLVGWGASPGGAWEAFGIGRLGAVTGTL